MQSNEKDSGGTLRTYLAPRYEICPPSAHVSRNLPSDCRVLQVPIVKFVDTHARIDIDLSFNQTNALEVVTLVQRYIREFPALRPLVMVLKTLFQQKKLSNPAEGGLGSYSIVAPHLFRMFD
jgi:DNA polymerase sigma